jgi:hypothetical protein
MIEQRLKEVFARAAGTGPSEAGAYDRFLRRRRRATRKLTAATGVALVLVLGLAVAVPRVLLERHPTTQVTTPTPGGDGTRLSRPAQGFEVDMPDGWSLPKVAGSGTAPKGAGRGPSPPDPASDPQILLFQDSPRAADMRISTDLIDPRYNALLGSPYRGAGPPTAIHYLKPTGTVTTGRRPDGRPFLRTTQNLYGLSFVDYYISWPYRCALGRDTPCPAVLALRVLHVQIGWSKLARPATEMAVAERVVRTARPIGNAVSLAPVPGQPTCSDNGPDRLGVAQTYQGPTLRDPKTGAYALAPGTVMAMLRLEDYTLVYCRVQHKIAVVIMDGDTVQRNGLAAPLSDALLGMVASQPLSSWASWEWTNWCGSRSATAWYVDPEVQPAKRLARITSSPPPCLDPKHPSVLQGGYVMP